MATKKDPLSVTHPDLAAQAHNWDPSTVTPGSGVLKNWRCPKGHIFENSPHLRAGQNQGCPVCSGKKTQKGFNDLQTTHPELAAEADGWDPTKITSGSGKKVSWRCKSDHQWSAVVASRTRGNGCPYCAGKKAIRGINDLKTTHPELAAQANGWDPSDFQAGSHSKVSWICDSEHVFTANIYNRTGPNRTGCPICSGKKVLNGFNDLQTTHPELAAEAFGWDTTEISSGSNKVREWQCSFGHNWKAMVNTRSKGVGCPVCTNKKVLVGFNDLATINPQLASEAFEWDPQTITQSSQKKRKWQCQFGHIWSSKVSDRTRGNGCPSCSVGGFDPNRPAWLYFIEHDEWKMLQIGITTQPSIRLDSHRRIGWELIEIRGPLEGHHIQEIETSILRSLRKRHVRFAENAGVQAFDGWTEAWIKDSLPATSIKELLDLVYEDGH